MDTTQIDYVLKQHPSIRTYYGGTYPSDALPRDIGLDKQCFVVNVDPSSQPGSHWVAFYFEGGKGEFFDSYGNEPSFYSKRFTTFLQRNSVSWIYNRKRVQGTLSTVCGQYCIFYNLKRCQDYKLTRIVSAFGNDFNKLRFLISSARCIVRSQTSCKKFIHLTFIDLIDVNLVLLV